MLAGIGLVVVAYLVSAELLKRVAITHIAARADPRPRR
jgi:hypothetical protein